MTSAMLDLGGIAEGRPEGHDRVAELDRVGGVCAIACATRVRSVYLPTVEETVNAVFDHRSRSYAEPDSLFEVPADQYLEVVRRIAGLVEGAAPESSLPELDELRRLKRGTVSYRQAVRMARSGRIGGMTFDAGTRAIRCDFPYGLSFAAEHARARWAGGTERAAVAMALYVSLKAGPNSAVYGLLSERLAPTGEGSMKAVRTRGALSGVAGSPFGHGATEGTMRTLSSVTSSAATGQLGLLAGASPVASTVAIGVASLDFYRAALKRSISWTQFTKNTVVKATGVAMGTGGWASGAVLGSTLCGPVGALVGGVAGAFSAGGLGAVSAKRIADRLVEDDAKRLMAIVRRSSEQLACEYLLTPQEVDSFAARVEGLVGATWLRRMFSYGRGRAKAGNRGWVKASRRFADRELDKICREIVKRRTCIVLPRASVIDVLLQESRLLASPHDKGAVPHRARVHSGLSKGQPGATL